VTPEETAMNPDTPFDITEELADFESAEEFLDYFGIAYERAVVQVNRLHILQRFHDYLRANVPAGLAVHAEYRRWLEIAYQDFVRSDAQTEKVFNVHKKASGLATVPISSIGRARH
jgi:nitrogenase-stabilizing/protective protein